MKFNIKKIWKTLKPNFIINLYDTYYETDSITKRISMYKVYRLALMFILSIISFIVFSYLKLNYIELFLYLDNYDPMIKITFITFWLLFSLRMIEMFIFSINGNFMIRMLLLVSIITSNIILLKLSLSLMFFGLLIIIMEEIKNLFNKTAKERLDALVSQNTKEEKSE